MALKFADSFQSYRDTAGLSGFGPYVKSGPVTLEAASSSRGGPAVLVDSTGSLKLTCQGTAANYVKIWAGFRIKFDASFSPSYNHGFLELGHAGSIANLSFYVKPNGAGLRIVSYSVVLLDDATVFTFEPDRWYFFEVYAYSHASAGELTVKIDGETVLELTGVDTYYTGGTDFQQVGFVTTTATFGYRIHDFYLMNDESGSKELLGPNIRIDAVTVDSDEAVQFTRSAGASNYANVDENPHTFDTDYNESSTVGHADLFGIPLPSYSYGVYPKGLQVGVVARKDDASARSIYVQCNDGSTDYNGSAEALTEDWVKYYQAWGVNPQTSNPWTAADLASFRFGVEVQA